MLLPLQLNNLLAPVSGVDALAADDLNVAVELSTPALGQVHALAANDLQVATELSTPVLVENVDNLTASDIQVAVEFSTPALSDGTVQAAKNKGGSARKGRKRYYVVEVDGQDFIVTSQSEVRTLLQQARALAEQSALTEAEKPQAQRVIPKIRVRTASGSKTSSIAIQREVRDTRAAIEAIYKDADRKVQQIRRQAERTQQALQDEEDAIIALLM